MEHTGPLRKLSKIVEEHSVVQIFPNGWLVFGVAGGGGHNQDDGRRDGEKGGHRITHQATENTVEAVAGATHMERTAQLLKTKFRPLVGAS